MGFLADWAVWSQPFSSHSLAVSPGNSQGLISDTLALPGFKPSWHLSYLIYHWEAPFSSWQNSGFRSCLGKKKSWLGSGKHHVMTENMWLEMSWNIRVPSPQPQLEMSQLSIQKSLLPLTQLEIVLNGKFPIKNIRFSSPQTWLETVLTSHQRNLFLVATDVTGNVLTSHQKCKDFIAINTARNCLNFPSQISDFHHHKHDWKCSKFLSEIFSFVKVNKDQNCPDFSSK